MYYSIAICVMAALGGGYAELVALQLNNYYPVWRERKALFFYLDWLAIGVVCTLARILSPLVGLIAFAVFPTLLLIFYTYRNIRMRTHYKFTRRATRLTIVYALITAALIVPLGVCLKNPVAAMLAVTLSTGLTRYIAKLAALIMLPSERARNGKYIERTRRYLMTLPIITIGITGSYGKTSCKNILAEMLSARYKVLKTEGNYNTPLGICMTVDKYDGERVFIAEMGAKRRGDIAELVALVRPKYAIITGVAAQHIESFGSVEDVAATKFELAKAIPPDGYIVFNADNEYARKMSENVRTPHAIAGYSDGNCHAENVKLNAQGSRFELVCGEERVYVETSLLGRHNVLNIVMCAALANKLGIPPDDIAAAVAGLKPVPHRLEARTSGGITIIDDSYNSNIEGVKCAFEVLSSFAGRKVVYTQGIVELGRLKRSMNIEVGRLAASVADVVILSGENSSYIAAGLADAAFVGELYRFSSLSEAEAAFPDILVKGDVLLIQNDIP